MEEKPALRRPIRQLLWFFATASAVKLLLIPSYHSTDFEVHRHWLALTQSLPLSQWYSDETSQWTLDYPPFFAYFERLLAVFALLVDPQMVDLKNGLTYNTVSALYFQRLTVILSDVCLLFGVYKLTCNLPPSKQNLIWLLVLWSPGLFIVDHIHFQYNGFLLGWLLLSISFLMEGRDLMGGFFFAVLLCFKHLFAVAAPVYFVYLLRHYCWGRLVRGFGRLSLMGAVVAAVFSAAYLPILFHSQMHQLISRMFPFGRGLCHAYWAPNFWVFYILLDKGLCFLLKGLGYNIQFPAASFTGGLVGDSSPFAVLPQVTPMVTFIAVVLALAPCLFKAWEGPRPGLTARWIAYAYTCGFLFGWHVHEKASLHFVIPLAVVAVERPEDAKHYFLLSIVSTYSLFPLLYEVQEYPVRALLLLLYSVLAWLGFSAHFVKNVSEKAGEAISGKSQSEVRKRKTHVEKRAFVLGWEGKSYLCGLVVVELWGQFLHPFLLGERYPFLPLMLMSIYCGFGILYSWMWQLTWIMRLS